MGKTQRLGTQEQPPGLVLEYVVDLLEETVPKVRLANKDDIDQAEHVCGIRAMTEADKMKANPAERAEDAEG